MPYREVLDLQRELHARVADGASGDTWIVCEHPAVITLGRNARREHVVASSDALAALGVDVVEVERGGDVTFHGPGQVVVYPILRLARFREVVPLVSALERAAIEAVASFGIAAETRREHRGVYVGVKAIGAIGLTVKRMTSMHGIALNVDSALDYDRLIVPCGMPAFGITSVAKELGRAVGWDDGRDALLLALAREFGVRFSREVAA